MFIFSPFNANSVFQVLQVKNLKLESVLNIPLADFLHHSKLKKLQITKHDYKSDEIRDGIFHWLGNGSKYLRLEYRRTDSDLYQFLRGISSEKNNSLSFQNYLRRRSLSLGYNGSYLEFTLKKKRNDKMKKTRFPLFRLPAIPLRAIFSAMNPSETWVCRCVCKSTLSFFQSSLAILLHFFHRRRCLLWKLWDLFYCKLDIWTYIPRLFQAVKPPTLDTIEILGYPSAPNFSGFKLDGSSVTLDMSKSSYDASTQKLIVSSKNFISLMALKKKFTLSFSNNWFHFSGVSNNKIIISSPYNNSLKFSKNNFF